MEPFSAAVEDWLDYLVARNLSPSSIKQYAYHLRSVERTTNGLWPGYPDLMRWLRSQKSLSGTTRHHRVSVVRSFFAWAETMEYIASNPARKLPLPRRERPLPPTIDDRDLRRLIDGKFRLPYRWGERRLAQRDKLIIRLLCLTGLRRAEASALDVGDIDLTNHIVYVRRGKGGKGRAVRFPDPLAKDLAAFMRGRNAAEPLFTSRTLGRRLTPNGVGDILTGKVSAAFGRRIHTHLLRHAYATYLSRSGEPIRTIQEMLGHASLATTQVYLQVTAADQDAAAAKLEALMRRRDL